MPMPPSSMMGMPPPPHLMNMPQQQLPQGSHKQQQMQGQRNRKVCRFFNTKQGCRDGPNCAFLHIPQNNNSGGGPGSW
jgi:hypothetical protein